MTVHHFSSPDDIVVPDLLREVRLLEYRELVQLCVSESAGLYLEFGVASGGSLKMLRKLIPQDQTLYGFDWFKGLPVAWNNNTVGTFAAPDAPAALRELPNTVIVEGLFEDTVPAFAAEHREPIAFMHIDCDIYQSTKTVLDGLRDNIVPGTVMLFDEFFGYPEWQEHEYRAFVEFVIANERRFVPLGRDCFFRVGVKIV